MRTKEWTYKTTHPWITFELDPASFTPELWVLLGECQSKCEHVAGVPLRPFTAKELNQVFLSKGVRATSAIEGNTLTEQEVRAVIEKGHSSPKSTSYLEQEVKNIVSAFNELVDDLIGGRRSLLTVQSIKSGNNAILSGLDLKKHIVPGEFRTTEIQVGAYKGVPHEECKHLVEKLCEWINSTVFHSDQVIDAILKSVLSHLYIAWIHPFADGNGRTARLVELELLLRAGVPAPSAHLLSDHYNRTREKYYDELDQTSIKYDDHESDTIKGRNVVPFIEYSLRGFVEGLRNQIALIRSEQWDIIWRNYVHEKFRDRTSDAHVRQRHLILDLSQVKSPTTRQELNMLTPRVAVAYSGKSPKTLTRDIRLLKEMELLVEKDGLFKANKEIILAFLPIRVE